MPPKKNKGIKMDLTSFLTDTSTGSWADEMDDMPKAPTIKDPSAPRRGDPDYLSSRPDRSMMDSSRGPPREELPLPTRPPYTAFVGGLDFEATEEDLIQFFGDLETVSAKLIKDPIEQKPKGFGYVEFKTLDGLKDALTRTGSQMMNRSVRVSVADAPKERGFGGSGGFGGGAGEEATQWRRTGPLAPRSPPQTGRSAGRYDDRQGGSGFGSGAGLDADRDWSAARGSKFAPAEPSGRGATGNFRDGPAFREGGMREPREEGKSMADMPEDWRSNRPARQTPPPAPERSFGAGGSGTRGGFPDREAGMAGPAGTEETWSRGTKFQAAPPKPSPIERSAPREAASPALSDTPSDWRSARKPSSGPGTPDLASPNPATSPTPAEPPTRRAFKLLPRSTSSSSTPTSEPSATAGTGKSSPFGAARAVDTSSKDEEAAAKAQKLADERKEKEKAAAETREKEKLERIEQEKAERAKKAAEVKDTPTPQTNGARGQLPPRPYSRGGAPPVGDRPQQPPRKTSAPNVHPSRLPQNQKAPPPAAPEVDEDGFVVAAGARRASNQNSQPKSADKDKESKSLAQNSGFSFAAAARASGLEGLVEDAANDDAGVEDAETDEAEAAKEDAGDVAGVTQSMKETAV